MAFNAQYDKTLVVETDVRQRNICLSRNDDRRKTDARGGTQPIYTVALYQEYINMIGVCRLALIVMES